ncbi:MAG TPA: hypothetical protein VKU41_20575 [Polyangiaceae bacterium]|nr:hypothetical protein [Polyangiaceae bacterium]
MGLRRSFFVLALLVAVGGRASSARADDESPDRPSPSPDSGRHAIDRTWLYADDARVAAPMTVIGTTSLSYTQPGSNPSRVGSPYPNAYSAFAANTAQPGAMVAAGGEVGLWPRLSVLALGQMGMSGVEGSPNPSAGAIAGVRVLLSPLDASRFHATLSAGYLREAWSGPFYDADGGKWWPGSPHGDNGGWAQAAISVDVERVRLATTLHAEHVFSDGRDGLDVLAELGASYRLVSDVRLGVEYVGQDLEESFDAGAEGGARHFVGPVASWQLLERRLSIVGGPSIGLSSRSPAYVGRLGLSYGF